MNLKKFSTTWSGLKAENKLYRIVLPVLSFALVISVWSQSTKQETVILVPPNIPEKMEVSTKKASGSFKRTWGLFVAELAGNVTPGNVDFVKEALQQMMSSNAWHAISESIAVQTQMIKDENLTIKFEPRDVYYEDQSDKVFVTGSSTITGSGGKSMKKKRVFELGISIAGYSPKIMSFDSYEGEPHTLDYIEREAKRLKKTPQELAEQIKDATAGAAETMGKE